MVKKIAHVDDMLLVADEQVPENAGLVQVSQPDHVLHPVDGGGVHGLEGGGILWRDPVFLHGRSRGEGREREVGLGCVCVINLN